MYDGSSEWTEFYIKGTLRSNSISSRVNIVKVDIGDMVTSIGTDAFSGCYKLETVTSQNPVLAVGSGAF